ncbi:MAG: hypothetical protein NZ920_04185 [Aigarchaeota archaeon]|nr:hypothetical protein [Aigarchaeota archaeon]MDW8092180.1 hypothetical protein [Nitrososphaerota archaeon]
MVAPQILEQILSLIEAPNVVGISTLRHYPMERKIYSRFGRCGFAIEVVVSSEGSKKVYSILVEARARSSGVDRDRSYDPEPGQLECLIAEFTNGRVTYKTYRGEYSNSNELFSYVERVRSAFYSKYRRLRSLRTGEDRLVSEEVFHAVGIDASDVLLGT